MHDHHAHDGHGHAPASYGKAFAIGIALNIAFVLVEAGYGFVGNSVALLADAGHNLSDVLGLVIAWVAVILSKRPPTARFTYGLRSSSQLAALFNAVILMIAAGAIGWESVTRLLDPPPVAGTIVMAVAAIGILVNGVTAALFASGRKGDLNIKGAYLHMLSDAAVSAGVVIAGALILFTGWLWLDPLISLAVVAVIVWGTWGLLRESLAMTLNAVPPSINAAKVGDFLRGRHGVTEVHDLHIWPISTTEAAMTVHLVMPGGHPGDEFLRTTADALKHDHGIGHVALQVELDGDHCPLAPSHIV